MKKLIISLMLLSVFANSQSLPIAVKDVLEKAGVGENNELLIHHTNYPLIREFVQSNQGELVTMVDQLGDARIASLLTRAGVKFLNDNDYIAFASGILGAIADGKISSELGLPIFYAGDKEGLLAVNYDDQRIAEVLPKVLPRYADSLQHTGYLQKLISGKAKVEHIDWYRSQGLTPAQPITKTPTNNSYPALESLNQKQKFQGLLSDATLVSKSKQETSTRFYLLILSVLLVAALALFGYVAKIRKPKD